MRRMLILIVLLLLIARSGEVSCDDVDEEVWAVDIYACDAVGTPQKYFPLNTTAHFNVTVTNPTLAPTNAVVSLSVRDALNVPVGVAEFTIYVPANASSSYIMGVFILDWSSIGNSIAHASLYVEGVAEGTGSTELFIWRPILISAQISFSKTIIGLGFDLDVSTTVLNRGPEAEFFKAFVYANTTLIHMETRIAESGIPTTFTFRLNTGEGAKGNYKIAVLLEIVLAEIYTLKGYFLGGAVYVGIPGDVNGDHIVNVVDLWLMASTFNSDAGDLAFAPNTDVNGDGVISMVDLYIAARHFGQADS